VCQQTDLAISLFDLGVAAGFLDSQDLVECRRTASSYPNDFCLLLRCPFAVLIALCMAVGSGIRARGCCGHAAVRVLVELQARPEVVVDSGLLAELEGGDLSVLCLRFDSAATFVWTRCSQASCSGWAKMQARPKFKPAKNDDVSSNLPCNFRQKYVF
jgi:hypothetical protein